MKIVDVFNEVEILKIKRNRLIKELEKNNLEKLKIQELCNHELVFNYHDNILRKAVIDGSYYCPACGKVIEFINQDQINNTVFKNSRIIPLNNISLIGTKDVHDAIRNEVYSNIKYYYNFNITDEDLSNKMEELLAEYQCSYESSENLTKREK